MNRTPRRPIDRSERGIALVIALFVLVLISVVALAVLLSSGMETSLAGNYRLSTQTFYAAHAGLEEARGRMWSKHPSKLGALLPNPMNVGTALYITNPAAGEVVAPSTLGGAAVFTPSVSSLAGFPGPDYKWVRITPLTEQSEQMDIDKDGNL